MLGEVLYHSVSVFANLLPHQLCWIADVSFLQLVLALKLLAELQREIPALGCQRAVLVVHEDVAPIRAEVFDDPLTVFP